MGVSAIQDTLNGVFKIEERRSYVVARIYAILTTIVLVFLVGSGLGCMFVGDFAATLAVHHAARRALWFTLGVAIRIVAWAASTCFVALSFAILYYLAPDWERRQWHWLTPGTVFGIAGWLIASFGLRLYLHFFNSYTVTYGSLGAVIILLIWFYFIGFRLLLGAEIDVVLGRRGMAA